MSRVHSIDENIHETAGEARMMAGWYFPLRSVIIRLPDGGLWVHSPVALDAELASEVEALGEVRWLIAPNSVHHLFVSQWQKRFPAAKTIAAKALRKKRSDLKIDATLDDESVSWPGIERIYLAGVPAAGESIFFHGPSKTLICTDLLFNLGPHNTRGWFTRIALRLAGAFGAPAQSRLVRSFTKDRPRAAASIERVLEWPFTRISMCHGDLIEKDAKNALRSACYWMLEGAAQRAG